MIAKKCDVCGAFYELYNTSNSKEKTNGFMWLNIDASRKYFSHDVIDCCPACIDSIKTYVNSLKGDSHD